MNYRAHLLQLQTSEAFSTAGRTVKSGLVASGVVSSWTWSATLLQSSSVAYNYGVRYASERSLSVVRTKLLTGAQKWPILVRLSAWWHHICTNQYHRYASGATVQILLFATLAIELKRRAPNAHTFLEVVHARYGTITHFVYITFGLMTNILVTAMLLTGGSAVASSLTGVPTAAACFLLPVGVVLYTMFGGQSPFPSPYAHQ